VLVANKDPLALQFDNKSPLEQHSVRLTFEILAKDSCNLLVNLPAPEVGLVRALIEDVILSTDITDSTNVKKVHEEWAKHSPKFRQNNSTHQCSLARMTLLCADIGIVQERFQTFVSWVHRLFEETLTIDAKLSVDNFYAGQLKFLDGYATPLFHTVSDASLLGGFKAVCDRFDENKARMKERNHIADLLKSSSASAGSAGSNSSKSSSSSSSSSFSSASSPTNGNGNANGASANSCRAAVPASPASNSSAEHNGKSNEKKAKTERKKKS